MFKVKSDDDNGWIVVQFWLIRIWMSCHENWNSIFSLWFLNIRITVTLSVLEWVIISVLIKFTSRSEVSSRHLTEVLLIFPTFSTEYIVIFYLENSMKCSHLMQRKSHWHFHLSIEIWLNNNECHTYIASIP